MCDFAQRIFKRIEMFLSNRASCRHRVTAKAQQHTGIPFGDQVQGVAQMKTWNRSP